MRLGQRLGIAAIAVGASAFARPAAAYESHFTGDDVHVTVDAAGVARVEHAIAYRVSGGTLKAFDVTGIEPEATIEPTAPVSIDGETGTAVARVERKSDRVVHVTIEGVRPGLKRGAFLVRLAYAVDLVRAGELAADGAMWRLGWTSPVAPEGFDGARVVLDVPAAPTEPRAIAADGTAGDDGRVITLRRAPDRDELEMARPHVARGEAATWTARIDPRAFPQATAAASRPALALPPVAPAGSKVVWLVGAFAALAGLAFGSLVLAKARAFARACAARGAGAPRGLVPRVPAWGRAGIAGVAFGAGALAQAFDRPTWGALGIALAMVAAVHRAPKVGAWPRGPGQWLALDPVEAFVKDRARDPLDAATGMGRAVLALAALASVALGLALSRVDPAWTWLAPLDAVALVALFATGSRAQLPPDRARGPARRLASLHRVLRRDAALRVAPWARVPLGATAPDELRLLVLPRASMPGVVGIEVGVAWVPTPAGYSAETEVLVRVRDDSAAAARMAALAPRRRVVPGRKPEERVVTLVPSSPSRAGAVALVKRLARELCDRRKSLPSAPAFGGLERRLPPNERLRAAA